MVLLYYLKTHKISIFLDVSGGMQGCRYLGCTVKVATLYHACILTGLCLECLRNYSQLTSPITADG